MLTAGKRKDYVIESPVDILFGLHGDCIRAGHGYQLFSAVKAFDDHMAANPQIWWGPIEGTRTMRSELRGMLAITPQTRWRVRCSLQQSKRVMRLEGQRLIIGTHCVTVGDVSFELPSPRPDMHAEMVTFKSLHWTKREHPSRAEFTGRLWGVLAKWVAFRGDITVGRRRVINIAHHGAQTGYAVGLYGLTPEQSLYLYSRGIGGRRHMGAGMFIRGRLPRWCRDVDRNGRRGQQSGPRGVAQTRAQGSDHG